MIQVRPYHPDDLGAVKALWAEAFPDTPAHNVPDDDIARKLAVDPGLFLVAVEGDVLVGTVMAGYEGHRGWVYYVATPVARRRQGIGRTLMAAAEKALAGRGCPKVNLQVRVGNEAVVGFYRALGYTVEDRVSMGKKLVPARIQREGPVSDPDALVSPSTLSRDLRTLGVSPGDVVLVHVAMSRLGWVPGGAHGVVTALLDAVGDTGTLVMPTQTPHLSEPSNWENPPVPESWWPTIRDETPAFDPAATPSRGMGVVPECFRTVAGTARSAHPQVSFAARGPAAAALLDGHTIGDAFGETSPLGALYDRGAKVLLLGVGYDTCTALHLAEVRATWPGKRRRRDGAPMMVEGERRWVTFEDLDTDGDDFAAAGAAFDADVGAASEGEVGRARARLVPMRALVDHAVTWMTRTRA